MLNLSINLLPGMTPVSYPSPGFAVVFNFGYYGHTAMVTDVGDGIIYVVEQNGAPYGTNIYYTSDVLCYLKYGAA